jgi:hypothetical protein
VDIERQLKIAQLVGKAVLLCTDFVNLHNRPHLKISIPHSTPEQARRTINLIHEIIFSGIICVVLHKFMHPQIVNVGYFISTYFQEDHMNIYEDKCLRDKMNPIIAREKEGKIVIAAHKDGCGLPIREDLGQDPTRAAYPCDYAVGIAGFLRYDSELDAYLVVTKSGEKLFPVLANYRA